MATLQEKVKKNKEKIDAIFKTLDEVKSNKIAQDRKEAVRIALENYKNKLISKLIWGLLVPIVLLIISTIISWIFIYGGLK